MMRGLIVSLAWRSLGRNPRRTLITFVVVAVAMWVILVFGMMFTKALSLSARDAAVRLLTGDGQIHVAYYLDDPGVGRAMPEPSGRLLTALNQRPVTAWAPRVRVPATIRSEYRSLGVTFLGVDPQKERSVSDLPRQVEFGRYLRNGTDASIVLGKHLIARLKTRIGKRVIIMSQAVDGHLAEQSFTIVGAFGGADGPQDQFAFTGLGAAQAMLGLSDNISEVSFDATDDSALPAAIDTLHRAAPSLDVQPWTEIEPFAFAIYQETASQEVLFFAIMFALMAIGIVNAQLMAVFERTRELGLLQALGMKPRLIVLQVMLESALLIGMGVLIGDGLAALTFAPFRNGLDLGALAAGAERYGAGRVLHLQFQPADVVTLSLAVWLLGILTTLWPARRASRTNPIVAMSQA